MTSLIMGTATFLLLIGYVIGKLVFGQEWPAGFATTTILILLSITLNAIFLGIIGEYIGRIFMQSKRRPTPIIEASLNDEFDARSDRAPSRMGSG
jgi:dolichol-phosphate mannosyltransferase